MPLRGLGRAGCAGVALTFSVVGATEAILSSECCVLGVPFVLARSASRLSKVARSVLPSSSSGSTPDRRISDSMRARRFSRPSMYLALSCVSHALNQGHGGTDPLGGCRFFSTWVKMHSVL